MTLDEIKDWWGDKPTADFLKRGIFAYWVEVTDFLIAEVEHSRQKAESIVDLTALISEANGAGEVDTDELLPCPFCGNEAETGVTERGGHYAECNYCGASSALVYPCGDPPEPIVRERWNRRA